MALYTGTQDAADLLLVKTGTALNFGIDRLAAAISAEVAAQSLAMRTAVQGIAEVTTERAGTYGLGVAGEAQKVDEYGRGATQKAGEPSPVATPLDLYQYPVGYTANFLKVASPADVVARTLAGAQALGNAVRKEIRLAFFGSTNRTVRDHLVDRTELNIKALVNGDGAPVPSGPNAEEFDGATHSHYRAIAWAGLSDADKAAALEALVSDVTEHGHGEQVKLIINRAQAGDFASIPGFVANQPAVLIVGSGTATTTTALDVSRVDNRSIGYFNGIEVLTRTWVPANYIGAYAEGDNRKPLRFRQRDNAALQGFQLAATNHAHPLYAEFLETEFGVAAYTRTNGAALYLGGATYVSVTA